MKAFISLDSAPTVVYTNTMETKIMSDWKKFKSLVGQTWDVVIEAGTGDPTSDEEKAIMDLGYWGKEISLKSIKGLEAGFSFSQVEKRAFVLRIFAPDGTHVHRHRSKVKLMEDAKRYGPATYPRGASSGAMTTATATRLKARPCPRSSEIPRRLLPWLPDRIRTASRTVWTRRRPGKPISTTRASGTRIPGKAAGCDAHLPLLQEG